MVIHQATLGLTPDNMGPQPHPSWCPREVWVTTHCSAQVPTPVTLVGPGPPRPWMRASEVFLSRLCLGQDHVPSRPRLTAPAEGVCP